MELISGVQRRRRLVSRLAIALTVAVAIAVVLLITVDTRARRQMQMQEGRLVLGGDATEARSSVSGCVGVS